MRRLTWLSVLVLALTCSACSSDNNDDTTTTPDSGVQSGGAQGGGAQSGGAQNGGAQSGGTQSGGAQSGGSTADMSDDSSTDMTPDVVIDGPLRAEITHTFGVYNLDPLQEVQPCISWTLNNDEAIYIEKVTLSNNGGYHHSNWFFVPEEDHPGEDGYWNCRDRGFTELGAAVRGGVLFAQSTQSLYEQQFLDEGVVIKIPPRHKIIAGGHLLNLANRQFDTELRMSLEIVHPSQVKTIVSPFRFTFFDLNIHPQTQTRVSATCDFSRAFQGELDMDLFWVLPHYHYLGNYFELSLVGGERDGEVIYSLDGFNAEPNGKAFKPALSLDRATGFKFTCGFNNPRDEFVGWGIGDQEMCVMLGFTRSDLMIDASVLEGQMMSDDPAMFEYGGNCNVIGLPKNDAQADPMGEELTRPLYMPPSDGDAGRPQNRDQCQDSAPDAMASFPATLSSLHQNVFIPSCSYSSCHGGARPIANLNLENPENLHQRLMDHTVLYPTNKPLVDPGNPGNSLLLQLVSECNPEGLGGAMLQHMPLNSPILMGDDVVATLRQWIADGAQDN